MLPGTVSGLGLVPIGLGTVPVQARYGAIFAVPAKGISVFCTINCQEPESTVFYKDLKWLLSRLNCPDKEQKL
jgi:hypothetical protein